MPKQRPNAQQRIEELERLVIELRYQHNTDFLKILDLEREVHTLRQENEALKEKLTYLSRMENVE